MTRTIIAESSSGAVRAARPPDVRRRAAGIIAVVPEPDTRTADRVFDRKREDIGRLLDDSGAPERVVYAHDSALHHISVVDIGFRRVLRFGVFAQSSMYLDDVYETDFEYPAYFHLALALRPHATRTLAIGLGGGTVVKRMWRDYPEMRVDVVETDPDVVDVARRFFALPDDPRIRVHVDDGRHFVETSDAVYDIVVVDAFDDYRIPASLRTDAFMQAVRERMSEGGVIVFNVIATLAGAGSDPFRNLYRALAAVWRTVWVFEPNEGVEEAAGNLILVASDTDIGAGELRTRIADRVDGRVTLPAFHLFGQDLRLAPFESA